MLVRILRKLKSTRRNLATRFVYPEEPVTIKDLICPLRYDILVRQGYFDFLERNKNLFENNFDEFVKQAKLTPYYIWFRDVACATYNPSILKNEKALVDSFSNQLNRASRLFIGFDRHGFDPRSPITLETGDVVLPTTTGKHVVRKVYAGDGCHRLALLWRSGYSEIPPEFYRVKIRKRHTPRDNTYILLDKLAITDAQYYSYLSLAYAGKICHDKEALMSDVGRRSPELLSELEQVQRVDKCKLLHAK